MNPRTLREMRDYDLIVWFRMELAPVPQLPSLVDQRTGKVILSIVGDLVDLESWGVLDRPIASGL